MTNVDNFKSFVKKNPKLVTYVRNGTSSWQQFYELYDLYGEDDNIWKDYLTDYSTRKVKANTNAVNGGSNSFASILEMAKNIDTNKLQDGITSIQKAISLFGDMILKDNNDTTNTYTPRPIYRKFDD